MGIITVFIITRLAEGVRTESTCMSSAAADVLSNLILFLLLRWPPGGGGGGGGRLFFWGGGAFLSLLFYHCIISLLCSLRIQNRHRIHATEGKFLLASLPSVSPPIMINPSP